MASLMLELLRRADMTPIPTEAEAAAAIASNKVCLLITPQQIHRLTLEQIFSLGSMFSQVVVDTFMAGVMTVQGQCSRSSGAAT